MNKTNEKQSGQLVLKDRLSLINSVSKNNAKCIKYRNEVLMAKLFLNFCILQGDSGSPLMCKVNKKWTLVGVHSFRINLDGCRGGAKAAARVSMYLTWISSIV